MRCCTILILLTVAILIPVIFIFIYMSYSPERMNNSQTTTEQHTTSFRPLYTQNWSNKDLNLIRASTTILGRGTLTNAGQFDVSTMGANFKLPETTSTPTLTTQAITSTISLTTTVNTNTTAPPNSTSVAKTEAATPQTLNTYANNDVSKPSDPTIESSPVQSTHKPFVLLTTPGSTEEIASWKNFKMIYRRRYPNLEEEERRRNIFIDNKRFIEAHNVKPNSLFTLGINKFADNTNEEINSLFIGPKLSLQAAGNYPPRLEFLSEHQTQLQTLDFRNTSASKPMDQGLCLDSAVYAAIGSIESATTIARQSDDYSGTATISTKLSEQQVIDCLKSTQAKSQICSGKITLTQVYEFLQKVPTSGLVSHKEYIEHQNSVSGSETVQMCNISHPEEKVTINSYGIVYQEHILEALANSGPLAFPIDASQQSFHFYKSGIYHSLNCSMDEYNYHSLLMGFIPEVDHTPSHYIIRNSLGTDWGEGGYMRLLKSPDRNKCLPQNVAIYPNLGYA